MSMSMSAEFLKQFVNDVFIETGTFDGRGAMLALEVGFKFVHTIELDPERAGRSKIILGRFQNVIVHEGDTVDVLPNILRAEDRRSTIFLDAHPVGENDVCKIGRYRHPLVQELELIRVNSMRRDHTIIVDDRHEFPLYPTTDEEVISLLKKVNPDYNARVDGDKVVATIST